MFRVGLVFITTLAILTCPYRCTAAGNVAASPGGEVTQLDCTCCHKSSPRNQPHESSGSEAPAGGASTCRCICDGALCATTTIEFTTSVNWIEGRDLVARTTSVDSRSFAQHLSLPDGIETGLCPSLSMQSLLL